jgi:cobalt/nickel transport protein
MNTGLLIVAIVAMVLLAAIPLAIVKDTEFGGSDGAGSELVEELAPDYDTGWISNIWEPPGGETESMLFALQAVAGGILIGYLFGYKRAERQLKK